MDIFYDTPFYGVPRLTAELKRRDFKINHKRVRRLQKALGLRTIYPRPHFNTSEPHPEHKKFPYLLKGFKIDHPNQVWSTDITYTAVDGHRAFVIGIVDWFSCKLMAYNVSVTCQIGVLPLYCLKKIHKNCTSLRPAGRTSRLPQANSSHLHIFTQSGLIELLVGVEI